jgi:hypothetical protein
VLGLYRSGLLSCIWILEYQEFLEICSVNWTHVAQDGNSWLCEIFAHHSNILIERLKLVAKAFGCVWLVTDDIDILDARASFFQEDTEDVLCKTYN